MRKCGLLGRGDILVSAFWPSTGTVARVPDAQRWGQHAAWVISRSYTLDALCGQFTLRPNSQKSGGHFLVLVLTNDDQSLAAEPVFYGQPPQGSGAAVM